MEEGLSVVIQASSGSVQSVAECRSSYMRGVGRADTALSGSLPPSSSLRITLGQQQGSHGEQDDPKLPNHPSSSQDYNHQQDLCALIVFFMHWVDNK